MSKRAASLAPAARAVPTAPAEPIADQTLQAFTTADLIGHLYRAAKPHLSRANLQAISDGASDDAERMARNAAKLAEGLGCLIATDGDGAISAAGNFQSADDVPALLFHLADTFRHVEALAHVASMAADELLNAQGGA